MAVTSESEGTQTATIGTEHNLATPTTAGTRILKVNLTNLAVDEIVELRIYEKVLTGDPAPLVAYYQVLYGPTGADDTVWNSVPITSPYGATFSLKQTVGTGRAFKWQVCLIA